MGPKLFDPIRILLPGAANAAADAGDDDCTSLIPETLSLLAGVYSLSTDELRTLARNLAILAQCAENRAERRGGFDMP